MIKIILWDIDGTLLDFHAAEREAIKTLFKKFELGECTDEMIALYSKINRSYWERLERGEVTKPQVLVGRFKDFFASEGLDTSVAPEFNKAYQLSLGDTIVFCDDSYNIVKSLNGKVKQYAVSNGTVVAQTKKLRLSGLGELFDGVYLSEDLGVEKPNVEFFDKVFAEIGPMNKDEVVIVGDSLTSDICGGNNAGILTCWYNPNQLQCVGDYKIDYEITDIHQIFDILNM
jgi:2-haloacid dehalogenase